ncbi:MAG: hypothetical protein JNJ46_13245 [Myxococcales bacterium]|jgi:Flp pilus assembly protein TadD|nr:hypothetical protein [Myxococcales bacterium]
MSTRIDEIKEIVALSPSDPFPLYGLAMEYRNSGDFTEAQATFARLQERFPDYVPQYLMHGQLLASDVKDRAAAKRVIEAGIERAQAARNHHALSELQSLLDRLDEDDDQV